MTPAASGGPSVGEAPDETDLLRRVTDGDIQAVYQPIVDLDGGDVVAFEALARGPAGTALESPQALFDSAQRHGLVGQVDWACKTAAVGGAVAGNLAPPIRLFVNSEPEAAGALMPVAFAASWAQAKLSSLQLIFEFTERDVAARPAELLRTVRYIRSLGWGIALDDVGADPQSLALLPFIRPDVIKLDMRIVQVPDGASAEVLMAVRAEAERSGALVLAEGIETEEHRDRALMYGADLGQGWFFGRPGPLPQGVLPTPDRPIRVRPDTSTGIGTPFEMVSKALPVRRASVGHMEMLSRALEERATRLPYPPVLLSGFQEVDRFAPRAARYSRLADRLPFVAVAARGMTVDPSGRVRGIALGAEDPLGAEWVLAVLSPYLGFLLAGRQVAGTSGDQRQYDHVITFDRNLAIEASVGLLERVADGHADETPVGNLVDFAEVMTGFLTEAASLEDAAQPLLEMLAELTGLETTFLSEVVDDRYEVRVSFDTAASPRLPAGATLPWSEAICKHAIDVGRSTFSDVQEDLPHVSSARDIDARRFLTCPVVMEDGQVIGTLCGASSSPGGFTGDQLAVARSFAELIALRAGSDRR